MNHAARMKRPNGSARNGFTRRTVLAALATAPAAVAEAQEPKVATVQIGYIRSMERHPTISLLDKPAPNDGLAGAQLGLDDNNTTGRFMGMQYRLTDVPVYPTDDVAAKLAPLLSAGTKLVLTDTQAASVLKLADAARPGGATIFNIQAPDDSLREENCRADVIHVAPTRSMLADALAEYLVLRKWTRWFVCHGTQPNDLLLLAAYRRSAKRYGARIVEEREYKYSGGSRETDTGLIQIQQQMPVFTQRAPEYDVLIAVDENQVFAGYLPYRTWDPRPVAGSAGLMPRTWDPSSESVGGTQMQDRFNRAFHRPMTPLDMNAWTAVRMIGEASSRTHSADTATIMAYMKRPDFQVAAYKGEALSLRSWNMQVRQPILLTDGHNVVSISPQPGFLHQVTDLDTLGVDKPETKCKLT